ncbi:MAG: hypothetical protein WA628_23795 [Terriglobales bacterium]
MLKVSLLVARGLLLAGVLAGGLLVSVAIAQSAPAGEHAGAGQSTAPAATPPATHHYGPNRPPKRASEYYGAVWGVDGLHVKSVESGELIRFTYHVLDATKAQQLNDKRAQPSLIDPRAGVSLEIPQLEKVGKLRQSSPAESGQTYWMAFSNKGRLVKRGDRVTVVIGKFRADGLVVE